MSILGMPGSTSDSTFELLQLGTPGPRPVWAVLDAVGEHHFTGEITVHLDPPVRLYSSAGKIHLVERESDPSVEELLLTEGFLTPNELLRGVITVAGVRHLGRLFDRVPGLDRDTIEVWFEVRAAEAMSEIAHLRAQRITGVSYRFHHTGMRHWWTRAETSAPVEQAVERAVDLEVTARPEPSRDDYVFDLEFVIDHVIGEADSAPTEDVDVPNDVKEAVRLALAEIEAAMRPMITAGLSMATLLGPGVPRLPEHEPHRSPMSGAIRSR